MKIHSDNFKETIKSLGRMQDVRITYTLNNKQLILDGENINSITPNYEASLLKSVMKVLELDSNVSIPKGTEIKFEYGLLVNGAYEYLDYGNYIVYSSEKQEDTLSYKITCYDKMLYSMKDYEHIEIPYPCTIKQYLVALCNKIGLQFKDSDFANANRQITNELFMTINEDGTYSSMGYTYRDVLDQIAEVTGGCICLTLDDEIEVRYVNKLMNKGTSEKSKVIHFDSEIEESITFDKLYGSHTQKNTQGKNLYNKDTDTKGWVYSNTGILGASTVWNTSDWIEVTPNAKYCISNKTTGTSNIFISEFDSDKNFITRNTTNPFTASATTKYIRLSYKNDLGMYEIQLEKGNTKTTYEPYTGSKPSPSPDYPQEIEAVGDNVQLLDNPLVDGSANGISWIINDDGTMIIDGTTTANTSIFTNNFYINAKEGETVTLSATGLTNVFNVGYKNFPTGKNIFVITKNNPINTKTLTADDLKNANLFHMYIQSGKTFNNQVVKIKLEKGTKATLYSPYGQGSVKVIKQNKNLLNKNLLDRNESYSYGTVGVVPQPWRGLKNRGTLSPKNAIKIKPNTNYVVTVPAGIRFGVAQLESDLKSLGDTGWLLSTKSPYTLVTQPNAQYIGFNFGKDDNSDFTDSEWDNFVNGHLQFEEGSVATNFVEHREEAYLLPVQQEMLEGDYIDSTEHHEWGKITITGTENSWIENAVTKGLFQITLDNVSSNLNEIEAISNYYQGKTGNKIINSDNSVGTYTNSRIFFTHKKFANNLAGLKAWLKSKYDEGNPVIIYYKLATPVDLELTDEQKKTIAQINDSKTYIGQNNIYSDADIQITYPQSYESINEDYLNQDNVQFGEKYRAN